MIFDFIQYNFVAIALTSFLMLFVLTNNNFEKRINRLFLGASSCVWILIFEEAWEAQLALNPVYEPLRVPLSALGYTLRPLVPYLLIMILKRHTKRASAILAVPLVLNTMISFSALFCQVSFGYTPDNEFVRGPLGVTPFLVAALYIVILLIQTIYRCGRGGVMEAMIISAIALLAFVSTIMESIFHFQFIQNPSMATSIIFYYLFLHSNQSSRDTLTGAMTRRRFYLDAKRFYSSLTAVISLDVNNLKLLNDKYGHVEGDAALVNVSTEIKRYMGMRATLYRTGGDEFMILCYKMSEADVRNLINKIRTDLEKTQYRCAIGYIMCAGNVNFDKVCHEADNNMYEDKRRMKAEPQAVLSVEAQ